MLVLTDVRLVLFFSVKWIYVVLALEEMFSVRLLLRSGKQTVSGRFRASVEFCSAGLPVGDCFVCDFVLSAVTSLVEACWCQLLPHSRARLRVQLGTLLVKLIDW